MSSERASLSSATADPGAIGLSLFGFALFVYGVQFVAYAGAAPGAATSSVATIYAVLVAAAGETLAGIFYILRGQGYQASILCSFGLWLAGLYLLLTLGVDNKAFAPPAVGWYSIALIIPVAYMAIPSFLHRNVPLAIAFVALIGVLLFLGIGFLSANLTGQASGAAFGGRVAGLRGLRLPRRRSAVVPGDGHRSRYRQGSGGSGPHASPSRNFLLGHFELNGSRQ